MLPMWSIYLIVLFLMGMALTALIILLYVHVSGYNKEDLLFHNQFNDSCSDDGIIDIEIQ